MEFTEGTIDYYCENYNSTLTIKETLHPALLIFFKENPVLSVKIIAEPDWSTPTNVCSIMATNKNQFIGKTTEFYGSVYLPLLDTIRLMFFKQWSIDVLSNEGTLYRFTKQPSVRIEVIAETPQSIMNHIYPKKKHL